MWPEGNAEVHPGRMVLWVGDQDMSKSRQPVWPLRKAGTVDLFKPQPFGTDQRGRWVEITLMFISMVIGAVPRMGKTFTLRELLLIAGMDPRAELHAYDLKGTGDLSPLAPISHRYRAGDEPEDIAYALADLRALSAELRRRAKVIRELPKDLCPENKVTPELADKKSLGLHPIVIGVDECQKWFEHPEYGAEIEEICTDLVKRGPALGIVIILATQRPDAKSIPTAISDNAVMRFCLKVTGQPANDMVLGTSAYRNGFKATTFSFRDKGIGILLGEGDEPRTTRTVNIDGPDAEQLAARARADTGGGRTADRLRGWTRPHARRGRDRQQHVAGRRADRDRRRGQGMVGVHRGPTRRAAAGGLRAVGRAADRHGQGNPAGQRAQAVRHLHQAGVGHRPGDRQGRQPHGHQARVDRRRSHGA